MPGARVTPSRPAIRATIVTTTLLTAGLLTGTAAVGETADTTPSATSTATATTSASPTSTTSASPTASASASPAASATTSAPPVALTTTSSTTSTSPSPTATTSATSTASPSPTTTTTPLPPRTTRSAQKRLNDLGCSAGIVDGIIGTRTKAAIIKFQAANALTQTGSMNTATWRKLEATRKVRCDRRPVPAYSGTGRRIVVSRTQNYVWLVRSDGTVRWQGGIIDNPSIWPSGTYRTGSACGRAAHVLHNSDYSGTLRLDHFTRVQTGLCGVAFHRVPVRKTTGTQIHANWMLGTNLQVSHGCMRVTARTAIEIWDFSQTSVTVVVKP